LIQRVLAALAVRFNDEAVSVDQIVFNAARIVKLSSRTVIRNGRPSRFYKSRNHPLATALCSPRE
jgi:hypothetical protein